MNLSVPGYNIYDKHGKVLYDGDIVKVWWGGVGGCGSLYEYHRLSISKRGRLSISGCSNIVMPKNLELTHPNDMKAPLNERFTERK